MINFPLSVWSPTSFQIVSHLRPWPVEDFGYHPGELNPICSLKGRMSLRVASRVKSPSGGRLQIERISSLTSVGCAPARRSRWGGEPGAGSSEAVGENPAPSGKRGRFPRDLSFSPLLKPL